MPEHKMIVIDGVRVRPEDVERYKAGTADVLVAVVEDTTTPATDEDAAEVAPKRGRK